MFKQQNTSCMKVGSGGDLDFCREYSKELLRPMFYSWCNCPLITKETRPFVVSVVDVDTCDCNVSITT